MKNASGRFLAYAVLAPLCFALGGCDTLSDHVKRASYSATTGSIAKPRTQSGDKIKLVVYGEDKLSGDFEVDANGMIQVPLIGAVLGAFLTTWVTFVPCFLWIFLGAPYMERLRANQRLSAALSSITAAVVGVVLNLAVWFAVHTLFARVGTLSAGPFGMLWPEVSSLDWRMLALSTLAFVLVFALKRGMAVTLAVCGVAGIVLNFAV